MLKPQTPSHIPAPHADHRPPPPPPRRPPIAAAPPPPPRRQPAAAPPPPPQRPPVAPSPHQPPPPPRRQPPLCSIDRTTTVTTVDVVDHSPNTDALERALERAGCCADEVRNADQHDGDAWVQRALQHLEKHHVILTVTDYRLIGWGSHDPTPRGWGCYRLHHVRSGQWYEMVASRSVDSDRGRGIAVMNNMQALLQALLAQPLDDTSVETIEDGMDMAERPTKPGWPPCLVADDHWWTDDWPVAPARVAAPRRHVGVAA